MERVVITGRKNERGASAIEFAIVLPVLIIILFGIIEFGLLLYNKQVITNASREGARAGIVSLSPRLGCPSIKGIVQNYCAGNLITFGTPDLDITCPTMGSVFGDDLEVRVTYHYDFLLLPNFITALTGGIDLGAVTVMRYE
jgi:Flp pilus assembly protein TadG